MMKKFSYVTASVLAVALLSVPWIGKAAAEEPEMIIVKYGKVSVKSTVPDAKVYVDDVYKGSAENVIENIMVGEHTISCRTETQTVSGKFTVKKDETLRLEARFGEKKLVPLVTEQEKIEKVEVEKKPKPEVRAPKPEKPKKVAVEAKKEEKKNTAEERRELHLNIIKVFFENSDAQAVSISHKINPKVISKFTEKKSKTGTYYQTKQGLLLCDAGPCEQQWSSSFQYTDEKGVSDSFVLTWKQTVFNGITPSGTSKWELLYCLNNACKTIVDTGTSDTLQSADVGRYRIAWSKTSLVVRRLDIMKEVTDSGGVVEAY